MIAAIRERNVTRPGFEPRQAESESAVLPLYYRAMIRAINQGEINNSGIVKKIFYLLDYKSNYFIAPGPAGEYKGRIASCGMFLNY